MENNWTLTVILLLSIFIARSQSKGDQDTASQPDKDYVIKQLTVFREQTFISGSDVTLQCGNASDIKWNELLYIVWNVSLQDKRCWLGLSPESEGTCKDGKRLYNTSDGVNLFIPKISIRDEGFYTCDVSYKAGSYAVNVSVSVTSVSTQLLSEKGQRIAVCNSIFKQKKPTLHWEPAMNVSSNISSVQKDMGFLMLENRVHVPADVNITELSCVATYTYESGSVSQKSTLKLPEGISNEMKSPFPWNIITIAVVSVCFILVFLAMVYALRRKLSDLSALKTLCCRSKISTPAEDKPTQPVDVEEVEPYASYIQRVNSIYNSSAELFNA